MFAFESGIMLGPVVAPQPSRPRTAPAGGSEIAFTVADRDAVGRTYAEWGALNLRIAQAPTRSRFRPYLRGARSGRPSLRVFAPGES